jgi:CheY-like chemotaxis protein
LATDSRLLALVAEDEPTLRNVIRIILQREGFLVLTTYDSPEAVGMFRNHWGPIHLLVTDVEIDVGLSGFDLAERILPDQGETAVLVISSDAESEGLAAQRGYAFVAKPFTSSALEKTVREVLSANQMS